MWLECKTTLVWLPAPGGLGLFESFSFSCQMWVSSSSFLFFTMCVCSFFCLTFAQGKAFKVTSHSLCALFTHMTHTHTVAVTVWRIMIQCVKNLYVWHLFLFFMGTKPKHSRNFFSFFFKKRKKKCQSRCFKRGKKTSNVSSFPISVCVSNSNQRNMYLKDCLHKRTLKVNHFY